jgi:hypothetical protein
MPRDCRGVPWRCKNKPNRKFRLEKQLIGLQSWPTRAYYPAWCCIDKSRPSCRDADLGLGP